MIQCILSFALCILSTSYVQSVDESIIALHLNLKILTPSTFNSWIKTTDYIKKEYPELALYHIECQEQGHRGCNIHAFRNSLYLIAMAEDPEQAHYLYSNMLNTNLYTLFAQSLGFDTTCTETYTAFNMAKKKLITNNISCISHNCIPAKSALLVNKIVKFNPYITHIDEKKSSFLTLSDLEKRQKEYASLIKTYEKVDEATAQEYAYYAAFLPSPSFIDFSLLTHMQKITTQQNYTFCCVIYPYTIMPHAVAFLLTKNEGISTYYFADSISNTWQFGPSHTQWMQNWYESQMLHIKQLIAFSHSYQLLQDSLIRSICLYTLIHPSKETREQAIRLLWKNTLDTAPLYTNNYKNNILAIKN